MRKLPNQGFRPRPATKPHDGRQFDRLTATELYCPKCGRSMPVRERLLLVLPEGDKYEYLCVRCGTSVGDRIDKGVHQPRLIV